MDKMSVIWCGGGGDLTGSGGRDGTVDAPCGSRRRGFAANNAAGVKPPKWILPLRLPGVLMPSLVSGRAVRSSGRGAHGENGYPRTAGQRLEAIAQIKKGPGSAVAARPRLAGATPE